MSIGERSGILLFLPVVLIQSGPNEVELFSEEGLQENADLRVFFNTELVVGIAGNRLTDPGSPMGYTKNFSQF